MSANPDEQHQRQIHARIEACQSELGNLEVEQQRLADRYATLKTRIDALREDLHPSYCQAEPFDQWSADEALAVKIAPQLRREAIEQKRAAMESDELERKRQREKGRVDETQQESLLPDPDQPLSCGGIVLNGEDTGFLLLKAIATLMEIASPEQGGAHGLLWCRGKARAMLDRVQQVGEGSHDA